MLLLRAIRGLARLMIGLLVLAPMLALFPAALLDQGGEGKVRASIFPLVLTAFDPFVWTCIWNSAAVATVVVSLALLVGVGAGKLLSRKRSWGATALGGLIVAPSVIAPGFSALGLRGLFGLTGHSIAGSLLERVLPDGWPPEQAWGWILWSWAATGPGVALMVLTTSSALRRLDPSWEDAARLSGAGPWRIWRTLTWPAIRPFVARTAGIVFIMTLVEPAAPLVLGLRRTLGFQLVVTALGPEPFPRIAALGLIAACISLSVRLIGRRWGGPGLLASRTPDEKTEQFRSRPGWLKTGAATLLLCSWLAAMGLPVYGLAKLAIKGVSSPDGSPSTPSLAMHVASRILEPPGPLLLRTSALLGVGVGLLVATCSWLFPSAGSFRRGWREVLLLLTSTLPPLVLGAGVIAIPRVLSLTARLMEVAWAPSSLSGFLGRAARLLDVDAVPGLLLLLGVGLVYVPRWLLAWQEAWRDDVALLRRVDLALLAGARPRRARRLAARASGRLPLGRLLLTCVLAASSIAPALILASNLENGPIGPGIVILADSPAGGHSQAAALACCAIAMNLFALGLAWIRRDPGSRGFPATRDLW